MGQVHRSAPDTLADAFNDGKMLFQRDLSGLKASLSQSKGSALGMMGNLDWKRTPQKAGKLFSNLLTDAMGRNGRVYVLSLVPGHPLFAELGKRLPAGQEHLGIKQAMDADRNGWQARSAAKGELMELMHHTRSEPACRDLSWRPRPFVLA
jgi:hypothetical protein